jgi:hypothetical protein
MLILSLQCLTLIAFMITIFLYSNFIYLFIANSLVLAFIYPLFILSTLYELMLSSTLLLYDIDGSIITYIMSIFYENCITSNNMSVLHYASNILVLNSVLTNESLASFFDYYLCNYFLVLADIFNEAFSHSVDKFVVYYFFI